MLPSASLRCVTLCSLETMRLCWLCIYDLPVVDGLLSPFRGWGSGTDTFSDVFLVCKATKKPTLLKVSICQLQKHNPINADKSVGSVAVVISTIVRYRISQPNSKCLSWVVKKVFPLQTCESFLNFCQRHKPEPHSSKPINRLERATEASNTIWNPKHSWLN